MVFSVALTKDRILARALDDLFHLFLFSPLLAFYFHQILENGHVEVPWTYLILFFGSRYFIELLSLYFFGTTLGKYLFQIQVQSTVESRGKLSFSQCVLRCTAFRFNFFMSWAPFVLALARYDRTHLIDWIAETKVVQIKMNSRPKKYNKILVYFLFFLLTYNGIHDAFAKFSLYDFETGKIIFDFDDER